MSFGVLTHHIERGRGRPSTRWAAMPNTEAINTESTDEELTDEVSTDEETVLQEAT